jgi:hypothetical protein
VAWQSPATRGKIVQTDLNPVTISTKPNKHDVEKAMKALASKVVFPALLVLATSLAAEAASGHHAARHTYRAAHAPRYPYGYQYSYGWQVLPPGYAYDTQANPNYGFGPIVKIH